VGTQALSKRAHRLTELKCQADLEKIVSATCAFSVSFTRLNPHITDSPRIIASSQRFQLRATTVQFFLDARNSCFLSRNPTDPHAMKTKLFNGHKTLTPIKTEVNWRRQSEAAERLCLRMHHPAYQKVLCEGAGENGEGAQAKAKCSFDSEKGGRRADKVKIRATIPHNERESASEAVLSRGDESPVPQNLSEIWRSAPFARPWCQFRLPLPRWIKR
jgi:hypothetical protein